MSLHAPVALELPLDRLCDQSRRLRRLVLETVIATGEGHIGAALSAADFLTALYFHTLRLAPEEPRHPDRDRFILSKGHASLALYAALALRGFFPRIELKTAGTLGSRLGGHPDRDKVPGVEASTGSLGHGIGLSVGMAFAARETGQSHRVFCLIGDGESQEGSVWEAAMAASQLGLDNLTVLVDHNGQQGMGPINPTVDGCSLAAKFQAFGWEATECDGNDLGAILPLINRQPFATGRPRVIIGHTVKGRGITYMENVPIWHYRAPNPEEAKIARTQLGGDWEGWEEKA